MAYLKQCLDSVFSQDFRDFFVVFVDDGSTDMSYEFAKMYERRHSDRMKALRLPEKRMAGGARNAGMDWPVECEYLYFMDSDDYLYSKDSLRVMHDAVAEDRPGLALFDWYVEKNGVVQRCRLGDFGGYVRENRLA
jgi:glycosyltransferase involved in cell wall biosynthesis